MISFLDDGAPVGLLMVVHPRVQVKPVKGDAAFADRDLDEKRAHRRVEAIAIHAEIARRVTVADKARKNAHLDLRSTTYRHRFALCSGPHEALAQRHARSRSTRQASAWVCRSRSLMYAANHRAMGRTHVGKHAGILVRPFAPQDSHDGVSEDQALDTRRRVFASCWAKWKRLRN